MWKSDWFLIETFNNSKMLRGLLPQHYIACTHSEPANKRKSNVEEQERVFNTINNITGTTSSYHASHITGNVFIQLEAEKKMKAYQTPETDKQEAHLTKLASTLPCFGNTTISCKMMLTRSSVWQTHLERISDFLLAGKLK